METANYGDTAIPINRLEGYVSEVGEGAFWVVFEDAGGYYEAEFDIDRLPRRPVPGDFVEWNLLSDEVGFINLPPITGEQIEQAERGAVELKALLFPSDAGCSRANHY